jgi:uncharacterized protein Yka (UPF0111/DUF47 family)
MPTKSLMIEELKERVLLLPRALDKARIKLCFTLLQSAQQHADHPENAAPDLAAELQAVELDPKLQTGIGASRRESGGLLRVPGASPLLKLIRVDLETMRAPLELAATQDVAELREREHVLLQQLDPVVDDLLPAQLISDITSARGPDTLHRLVMDLHKALNALQSALAQEVIDGARCWRIQTDDRSLIKAFMAGLNETAPLKFAHPGLSTTATRSEGQLVLQNDIGTTDAHILVLRVEDTQATLTYTDVHPQRLEFLQTLLEPFNVSWNQPSAHHNETLDYQLTVGRYQGTDRAALERYLKFLGSRLVFLIDWNHARKRLREFLVKGDAVRVLKWAADQNVGHRGFIELGGEKLLYEAIGFAQRAPSRYGERLHEMIGPQAAYEFIKFVLRESATGLLQHRAERFIRDEIKADLARRFRSGHASILLMCLRHAERVFDLAIFVQEGLSRYDEPQGAEMLQHLAQRAARCEQECDSVVSQVRSLARRAPQPNIYSNLLHTADEAADGLEEAAFLVSHVRGISPRNELLEPLRLLAALLVAGAQESVKMFAVASNITRESSREDVQDFFAAVDSIVSIEHRTDIAERTVTSELLAQETSARTVQLGSSLAAALERAADGLSLTALMLRDHLLNDVMSG